MCHGLLRRQRHGAFSLPPAYMMYRSYSLPNARVQVQRKRPTWRIKALAQVCIVPLEVECFGPIAQWNEWRFPVGKVVPKGRLAQVPGSTPGRVSAN